MLKILSWNILQGGGSRVTGILKFIAKQSPQIIVLSEFKNNEKGKQIRNGLLQINYLHQAIGETPNEENTVLVASKLPFHSQLYYDKNIDFNYGVVAAKFSSFNLYGVYLPHKKKHQLFPLLKDEIIKNKPSIIAGDFNSGKNFIDQKGDSFWYEKDLKELEKNDMVDAFRHINGDVKAYSWYSHQGNGYRYDHTYIHTDLLPVVKHCDYIHSVREEKISDHSAMILELG